MSDRTPERYSNEAIAASLQIWRAELEQNTYGMAYIAQRCIDYLERELRIERMFESGRSER